MNKMGKAIVKMFVSGVPTHYAIQAYEPEEEIEGEITENEEITVEEEKK